MKPFKAQLSKIFFIFSLIFFAVSANNYMEMRERIANEEFYRQSQNKFQNGDLSNFNAHTRRHLQRLQSPHQQAGEEQLAPDQEAILAVLEENSKMLKAKDSVGLTSSKYWLDPFFKNKYDSSKRKLTQKFLVSCLFLFLIDRESVLLKKWLNQKMKGKVYKAT